MIPKQFGRFRVTKVLEYCGRFLSPMDLFSNLNQAVIDEHYDWMVKQGVIDSESGDCILSFHSYLIETDHHKILIDTCVGEDKERKFHQAWHRKKWPWLKNLQAQGVGLEDIDFVMCTHLHSDHVGWNTRLQNGVWVPTFPNAKYIFSKTEYTYWEARADDVDNLSRAAYFDSVLPIVEKGNAMMVDENFEFESGIWFEPLPGHTPGQIGVHIKYDNDHVLFTGDMMHHPLQVPESNLSSQFCLDKKLSSKTRSEILERYANTATILFPQHFPNESAGRVIERADRLMFEFL